MKSSRTIFGWLAGLAALAMALGLLPVVMLPDAARAASTSVTVTKYAADGTTVLAQTSRTYQQMRDTMTVLGDGTTHYYHQGPVFLDNPDDAVEQALRWNASEDTNVLEKDMGALRGTNIKDLCDLVGGMSAGEELKVRSSDGWNRMYAYKNVYQYSQREGPMVLTWQRDGQYPDTGYSEGMRLVWFADTSVNPWGIHAFGNWDWHEAADPQYWYYYGGQYPTTTGLSGQYVSDLIIYSNDPAPVAPVAGFTADKVSGTAPLTVHFTDQSTGSPTSWAWDFESDGHVDSTARNPTHAYNAAGTYSVKLTVTNAGGNDSEEKGSYITVTEPEPLPPGPPAPPAPPAAAFSADATSGTAPLTVHFTDQSTGSPTSWAWDFESDGHVDSTARNPTHAYNAAGTYSVKLTVTNAGGDDSEEKGSYITVTEPEPPPPGPPAPPAPPAAAFSADATSGTAPLTVHFTDQSTGSPTSWAWDFESDGHVDSTARNPTHAYNAAGTYSVKLTVTNAGGNDSEEKTGYITVAVPEPPAPEPPPSQPELPAPEPPPAEPESPIAAPALPVAAFTSDVVSGTAPLTVQFSDNSTGNPTAWEWDFDNDGDIDSSEQNPAHTFDGGGMYDVKLTVSNPAGRDSDVKAGCVTVTAPASSGGWTKEHYALIVAGAAVLAAVAGVAVYALKARGGLS